MGARPLRRAIQRYIEDPLADEVLRSGEIATGTTVVVDRDEAGDSEDPERPLSLKLVKPKKRAAKKKAEKEPVAVGAAGSDDGPPATPQGGNGGGAPDGGAAAGSVE
jgi:ATP-dependent Clp protease ATP-binding subunit ClpC